MSHLEVPHAWPVRWADACLTDPASNCTCIKMIQQITFIHNADALVYKPLRTYYNDYNTLSYYVQTSCMHGSGFNNRDSTITWLVACLGFIPSSPSRWSVSCSPSYFHRDWTIEAYGLHYRGSGAREPNCPLVVNEQNPMKSD